jgi:hypothetical protein
MGSDNFGLVRKAGPLLVRLAPGTSFNAGPPPRVPDRLARDAGLWSIMDKHLEQAIEAGVNSR